MFLILMSRFPCLSSYNCFIFIRILLLKKRKLKYNSGSVTNQHSPRIELQHSSAHLDGFEQQLHDCEGLVMVVQQGNATPLMPVSCYSSVLWD